MPLVYSGIVPHSPILVPSVGREHYDRATKTISAMRVMEKELYARFPETIIVISPQAHMDCEHFTIDMNEDYVCDLREFGDFETEISCKPDFKLAQELREHLEDSNLPVMFRSEEMLDYGITVPLRTLAGKLRNIRILPLYPSMLSLKKHFTFGQALKEAILATSCRVAVLASVGLSHKLTKTAPGGFDARGREFDERILDLFSTRNSSGMINFDENLAKTAGENALRPLTILSGIMDRIEATPEILSYEAPFGIGFLVAHYLLT